MKYFWNKIYKNVCLLQYVTNHFMVRKSVVFQQRLNRQKQIHFPTKNENNTSWNGCAQSAFFWIYFQQERSNTEDLSKILDVCKFCLFLTSDFENPFGIFSPSSTLFILFCNYLYCYNGKTYIIQVTWVAVSVITMIWNNQFECNEQLLIDDIVN